MKALFITGTDTNCGKTYVSTVLLKRFNKMALKTLALKPIASGCFNGENGTLYNTDALELMKYSTVKKTYTEVNPFAFKDPIAPHIAAVFENKDLTKELILKYLQQALKNSSDLTIIEGAGGWLLPLNLTEYLYEVVLELKLPVILVVAIKLGCLNHALLTVNHMKHHNAELVGWIANCLDPSQLVIQETIGYLKNAIEAPCLSVIGYERK